MVARVLRTPRLRLPANDTEPSIGRDVLLRGALRFFAEHGLGAAERARMNAEKAFFAGDRAGYQHWLAICRTIDRRMADAVRAHAGGEPGLGTRS